VKESMTKTIVVIFKPSATLFVSSTIRLASEE
jgi:hypothetical protein